MNETELLREGVTLMFVGMGFVLCFLFLLIVAMNAMSKAIQRFLPEQGSPSSSSLSSAIEQMNDDELTKLRPVIIAAIAHHRRQQAHIK